MTHARLQSNTLQAEAIERPGAEAIIGSMYVEFKYNTHSIAY
jgi:hypothetical protein